MTTHCKGPAQVQNAHGLLRHSHQSQFVNLGAFRWLLRHSGSFPSPLGFLWKFRDGIRVGNGSNDNFRDGIFDVLPHMTGTVASRRGICAVTIWFARIAKSTALCFTSGQRGGIAARLLGEGGGDDERHEREGELHMVRYWVASREKGTPRFASP